MLFYLFLLITVIEYVGLGRQFPIIKAVKFPLLASVVTMVVVLQKNGFGLFRFAQSKVLLAFFAMTFLSLFHALITSDAMTMFENQLGYMIFFINAYYLLDNEAKIRKLMITMVAMALGLRAVRDDHVLAEQERLARLRSEAGLPGGAAAAS